MQHPMTGTACGMRTGPSTLAVLSTFEPVVTTALAALALGESLTPVQLAGGLLVLASVAVAQLRVPVGSDRAADAAGNSARATSSRGDRPAHTSGPASAGVVKRSTVVEADRPVGDGGGEAASVADLDGQHGLPGALLAELLKVHRGHGPSRHAVIPRAPTLRWTVGGWHRGRTAPPAS
ncbi:DMT family transporter [Geodermatophilus poikilotrophus]|uniref:EamA family transporter n=1 Tax=Geodermatophilus poikilotrophus TaxID=1333667 RepID=UPI000B837D6C